MSEHKFTKEELDDCIERLQGITIKDDKTLKDAVTKTLAILERVKESI